MVAKVFWVVVRWLLGCSERLLRWLLRCSGWLCNGC